MIFNENYKTIKVNLINNYICVLKMIKNFVIDQL